MKDVMLWAGAGQIGMAIARRMGAGFDVTPVEMDLSSRSSIKALIAGGRGTARSRCWSTLRVCRPVRRPSRRS